MWQRLLWLLSIYFCFLIYLCICMYTHTYLCIPIWFPERERDKLQLACRELYLNHCQSLLPFLIIFMFLSFLLIIDPPLHSERLPVITSYQNVIHQCVISLRLQVLPEMTSKKKKKWCRWVILWKWEFPRARLKHKFWGHL